MDAALQVGYRLIDTAFVYGNEGIVGSVLKKWFDAGKLKREDVFVTTKLPNVGNRRADVEKYLKRSLEMLGLDYVDLFLVHHPVGLLDNDDGKNLLPKDPETGLALFDMNTDHVELWKVCSSFFFFFVLFYVSWPLLLLFLFGVLWACTKLNNPTSLLVLRDFAVSNGPMDVTVSLPSARLTLHSTKLCTKFKIFRKKKSLVLRLPLRHFKHFPKFVR
jgi:hypothetical protein